MSRACVPIGVCNWVRVMVCVMGVCHEVLCHEGGCHMCVCYGCMCAMLACAVCGLTHHTHGCASRGGARKGVS